MTDTPRKKILYADADNSMLPVVHQASQERRSELTYTPFGRDGRVHAQSGLYSMVIIAAEMPAHDEDGYSVCATIKSDPATAHLPVLILTRSINSEQVTEHRASRFRADDYMETPFSIDTLRAKMANIAGFDVPENAVEDFESKLHVFLEESHRLAQQVAEKDRIIEQLEQNLVQINAASSTFTPQDETNDIIEALQEELREKTAQLAQLTQTLSKTTDEKNQIQLANGDLRRIIEQLKSHIRGAASILKIDTTD